MKNKRLLILLFIGTTCECLTGQVTLSPRIGLTYFPKTIFYENSVKPKDDIGYVFGVVGSLPVHEKWCMNTAISYVNRKDVENYSLNGIDPG